MWANNVLVEFDWKCGLDMHSWSQTAQHSAINGTIGCYDFRDVENTDGVIEYSHKDGKIELTSVHEYETTKKI